MPRWYYRIRWLAWYPLQWRLPPRGFLTLGEAIFAASLLAVAGNFAHSYLYSNSQTGAGSALLAWLPYGPVHDPLAGCGQLCMHGVFCWAQCSGPCLAMMIG